MTEVSPEFRKWSEDTIKSCDAFIESQAKKIAMLREKLLAIAHGDVRTIWKAEQCSHGQYGYENCEACYADYAEQALSDTQATADAFLAEVKARALEEAAKHIERAGKHVGWHHAAKDWPTDAREAIKVFSENMAAELRNRQPEQKEFK